MPETPEFIKRQYEFAAYLRDPDNRTAPDDVEARRMAIYSDLFFNNVRRMLAGNFPILSAILGEERWALLVRDFYRDHQSKSPLFPDMPREFLHYLSEERASGERSDPEPDLPFMLDLAHYEWIETGLMLAEEGDAPADMDENGDLLTQVPLPSKLAWLVRYDYPVNEIGPDDLPDKPSESPHFYLVYRDSDELIHFVQLNAVTARLLEILQEDSRQTGNDALLQVAAELQHPEPQQVVATGQTILEQWRDQGIVLGTVEQNS